MGFTVAVLKITNELDRLRERRGEIPVERVRTAELPALADTGSYMVSLPAETIRELGLPLTGSQPVLTAGGTVMIRSFSNAHLEMFDRHMTMDVLEGLPGTPALIAVTLMELFDLIVDPRTQRILPRDSREWGIRQYLAS